MTGWDASHGHQSATRHQDRAAAGCLHPRRGSRRLARAGLAEALPHSGGSWPWATFAVNLAGAALLAWLTTRLDEIAPPSRYARLLLATGLCGALTTFSTFQIEVLRLAKDGYPETAAGYAGASVAAGMAIAITATVVARRRRYG